MSAILDPTPDSPAPAQTPDAAQPVVERPCATCGAALAEGQDWCLECGSAQPGRLGGRPGWRAALTVLGVTALLTAGAGAASYAALDSEARRDATAQAPPVATPTQQTPPATPPETPPVPPASNTDEPATDEVDPPDSDPADVPAPSPSPSPSPTPTPTPSPSPSVTPPATSGGGSSGGSTPGNGDSSAGSDTGSGSGSGSGTSTGSTKPEPKEIELKSDYADTYDPFQRGGDAVGDPADAVDGKQDTAWEAPVGPDGNVRIGLLVSLEKAQKLGDLEMQADTPGFTVEMYATKSDEVPPDVLDARWKHLDDARDVGIRETLKLDGTYRHVLLWITKQPADTKVAIPEIKLFQQED